MFTGELPAQLLDKGKDTQVGAASRLLHYHQPAKLIVQHNTVLKDTPAQLRPTQGNWSVDH